MLATLPEAPCRPRSLEHRAPSEARPQGESYEIMRQTRPAAALRLMVEAKRRLIACANSPLTYGPTA
jgi:hypothetical protein